MTDDIESVARKIGNHSASDQEHITAALRGLQARAWWHGYTIGHYEGANGDDPRIDVKWEKIREALR